MLQLIFLLEGVIVYDDYFTMIKCKYKIETFFQKTLYKERIFEIDSQMIS